MTQHTGAIALYIGVIVAAAIIVIGLPISWWHNRPRK